MPIYCIDIDNTICRTKGEDYKNAKPIKKRIRQINNLWSAGNKIIYYTSRGYVTKKKWRKLTEKQLIDWGAKYNKLLIDKPFYDYFIDDKAINTKQFFK